MLSSFKDLVILGGVVALHVLLLFFTILQPQEPEKKEANVLQAELLSPPPPAAKAPPPAPPPPASRKPPPQILTVAPAQKQAPTKAKEPVKETPKQPVASPQPPSVKEPSNATNESAKTDASTSSSNTNSNSKSSTPEGVDAGPVELNQLVMVYRPDTEVFYPRLSKDIGEQGVVGVRLFINESGEVKSVTVAKSSGFERLDKAALQLASRIRFKPYLINGTPSRVNAGISIKFQLNR